MFTDHERKVGRMKHYVAKMSMVVTISMFVMGIVMMLTASSIGQKKGEIAIRNNGGSMETARYYRIIESSTLDYRMAGLVLGLVGGYGMVTLGVCRYKEME